MEFRNYMVTTAGLYENSPISRIVRGLIYFTIFISPYSQLPIYLIDNKVLGSLSRAVGLVLTFFFFLNLLFRKKKRILLFSDKNEKTFIFFITFIVFIILVSSFEATDFEIYLDAFLKLVMSVSFAVIIYYSIFSLTHINKCLLSYLLGTALVGSLGVYNLEQSKYWIKIASYHFLRMDARTDPNMLAFYALIAIPLCILFILKTNQHKRIFFIILNLFCVVVLFLTYSRAGIIGFFVQIGFLLFFLTKYKTLPSKIFLGLLLSVIFITPIYFVEFWHIRFHDFLYDERFFIFKEGIEKFINSPFWGVGYYQFSILSSLGQVAHNTFLELAVGAGIAGVTAYVMFMYVVWRSMVISKTRNELEIVYKTMFRIDFAGLIVMSSFMSLDNDKVMWMMIGLILCVSRHFQNSLPAFNNLPQNIFSMKA